MGILTRIAKIFKADIHGVMDRLEDQGLLLKQHLRDMEATLDSKGAILRKMIVSRNQTQKDYDKCKQQCDTLENDLTVAIRNAKDEIAKRLIKKKKPLVNLLAELSRHIKTLDDEILGYQEHIDEQQIRYKQLKHQSSEYFHKAQIQDWENNMSELSPKDFNENMTEMEIELELLKRKEELGA